MVSHRCLTPFVTDISTIYPLFYNQLSNTLTVLDILTKYHYFSLVSKKSRNLFERQFRCLWEREVNPQQPWRADANENLENKNHFMADARLTT